MPIPVILNPAARSTKAASLEQALRMLSPKPELHLTTGPNDAAIIAEKLAIESHELVVSAGGDGTLGDRAAAVLRDALQGSSAVELVLPRADVMCALAEVNEMRSRLQEIRVRCRR